MSDIDYTDDNAIDAVDGSSLSSLTVSSQFTDPGGQTFTGSIKGKFEQTLSNGEVLADDGNLYTSVQTAENNATDYLFIGPGSFNESVVVDTSGLTVVGSGRGTLIDGGTSGHAINISANNVVVRSLSVQTTAGGGNPNNAINFNGSDDCIVDTVWVRDSDQNGIDDGTVNENTIINCTVEAADGAGIFANRESNIENCYVQSGVGGDGIDASGFGIIVLGCRVEGVSGNGISCSGDTVIGSNRVKNAGTNGISAFGTDDLIFNNRISGSSSNDLDTSNATTPTTDANVTGSIN